MNSEVEEIYEGWADAWDGRPRKKGKKLDVTSKTAKQIRRSARQAGKENRLAIAQEQLTKVASRLARLDHGDPNNDYFDVYATWVSQSRVQGYPVLDRSDVEVEAINPSVGAGGQHRDHKRTARQMFHTLTGIEVVSAERVGGQENSQRAFERMYEKLEEHVGLWKELLPKKLPEAAIKARVLVQLRALAPVIQRS